MKFEIITIFPDFFRGPLEYGIVRRARESGRVEITVHDLRAFTKDKHRTVDDRPFGGGEGMVLKPEPIFDCLEFLRVSARTERIRNQGSGAGSPRARESVVLLSPQGEMFNQRVASEMARLERVFLICGRYEGVDERVREYLADREVSVGDFVLSGGELPAAIIVDAVTRLLPGALGNAASARTESFGAGEVSVRLPVDTEGKRIPDSTISAGGLLDYPHYTRPADFRGLAVPEPLVSGDHEAIRRWRRRKALEKTLRNRPELLERVELNPEDRQIVEEIRKASGFGLRAPAKAD
ncbi:MAG: tRNA (guanosine(37)-N1)-methyltransferase TrmD [Acidobacteriia bacterium]|nr:tRNA (guanosine(37)-N1)-methyltransferase TrmD [Terriglobia bacterium]